MTTQGKSKSKTFPKGTEFAEMKHWIFEQAGIKSVPLGGTLKTDSKVLITITKLPEEGKKK